MRRSYQASLQGRGVIPQDPVESKELGEEMHHVGEGEIRQKRSQQQDMRDTHWLYPGNFPVGEQASDELTRIGKGSIGGNPRGKTGGEDGHHQQNIEELDPARIGTHLWVG